MTLLPYEQLIYESPLQKEEVIKKLTVKIDPNPPFLNWKFGKLEQPFKGTIDGNKFMISKILSNSSRSLPYFFGEISENKEGSTIHITIKPATFIIAFSVSLYAIILGMGLVFIFVTNKSIWPGILFPLGAILFSHLVSTIAFKSQASFLKDDLMEIFQVKRNN